MTPAVEGIAPLGDPGTATTTPVTVDAVIVAYNSRDTLRACVEPLAALPWVKVTVVDNASPDDSAAVVADLPIHTIRAPRNGGFAYGCNLGSAAGAAEFVLFLNPDAMIEPPSLRTLVNALREDPALGGVGPRTVGDGGQLVWTQRRFPRLRSTYSQALGLHHLAAARELGRRGDQPARATYARPGDTGLALRWMRADAQGGARRRRRPGRGLLPLLGGNGPVSSPEGPRLASALRAARDRLPQVPRIGAAARAPPRSWPLAAYATHASITARSSPSLRRSAWRSTHLRVPAAWTHRPARRRGHLAAARAALSAVHRPASTP